MFLFNYLFVYLINLFSCVLISFILFNFGRAASLQKGKKRCWQLYCRTWASQHHSGRLRTTTTYVQMWQPVFNPDIDVCAVGDVQHIAAQQHLGVAWRGQLLEVTSFRCTSFQLDKGYAATCTSTAATSTHLV